MHTKHHSQCLLCGQKNPWSLALTFSNLPDGSVQSIFQAHSKLQGYDGILHGGVTSALLDSAMTHCLFHRGIEALTADLQIRFLHPIPTGACLKINAQIASENSKLYCLEATIIHKDKLMAKAKAKFMPRQRPSPH